MSSHQLWGGRFTAASDPAMRALNDSVSFDRALYAVDIAGSIAYAYALARAGIITDKEAQQLEQGLEKVLKEFENGTFVFIESDEDIHTAVERRLGDYAGAVVGKLHTGRSRNDQVATDIRLWLRDAAAQVEALLVQVQRVLVDKAEPHIETLMPGYTHMQPAQPITAAHWLMSFFWMLQRDRERLADSLKRNNISPLGVSALAGTPYPIDREQLAADLDFDGISFNSLDAVSDRDGVAEFLFIACLIGVHLSRLAEDIILYSNPTFGFVTLPDAYSTGSSLMPQKRNADPMELARGKAGRLIGHLAGFLATLKGLPSGYNKDLQEDKEPLFDAMDTLTKLLPVVAGLLHHLTLNPERMRAALESSMLATELADWLVMEKGVPFRQAHHVVGQAVRRCEEQGATLDTLPMETYCQISAHFDERLYAALDFEVAVNKRVMAGGTGAVAVHHQLQQAKLLLE